MGFEKRSMEAPKESCGQYNLASVFMGEQNCIPRQSEVAWSLVLCKWYFTDRIHQTHLFYSQH